jgi:hypothetical protein
MSDIRGPIDGVRGPDAASSPRADTSGPLADVLPLRDASFDVAPSSPDAADADATLRLDAPDAPLRARIAELQLEHSDLNDVIERLYEQPGIDDLRLRRLKKRKLQIRDALERLQMHMTPDIPA